MLVILISILGTFAQTPLPPLWPDVFWQNFTEITYYPNVGTHQNSGAFYYNYSMPAYRIDRDNGKYDRFCGLSGPYVDDDTPCSQIVVNSNRYLYYPALNECCYCCNSTAGCGVLFPSWLQDAKYVDTEVHNGVLSYKWSKKGGQDNFIWETTGNVPVERQTIAINQVPDDDMNFHLGRLNSFPYITLPTICTLANTCNWGYCQELRSGSAKHQEAVFA